MACGAAALARPVIRFFPAHPLRAAPFFGVQTGEAPAGGRRRAVRAGRWRAACCWPHWSCPSRASSPRTPRRRPPEYWFRTWARHPRDATVQPTGATLHDGHRYGRGERRGLSRSKHCRDSRSHRPGRQRRWTRPEQFRCHHADEPDDFSSGCDQYLLCAAQHDAHGEHHLLCRHRLLFGPNRRTPCRYDNLDIGRQQSRLWLEHRQYEVQRTWRTWTSTIWTPNTSTFLRIRINAPGPADNHRQPRVTSIERQDPTSTPTNADTLTWRVTFNEDVDQDCLIPATSGATFSRCRARRRRWR